MPTLSVPIPQLEYEVVSPGLAALEEPLVVRCAAVTFPDGSVFDQRNLGSAGLYLYRQRTPGVTEIWNRGEKVWQPDPGTALGDLEPEPFIFKPEEEVPWQGLLVAAGRKDKNGVDQFQKATPEFPRYLFRAYFAAARNGSSYEGLSAPSASVRFVSMMDTIRVGLKVPEDQSPQDADEVAFFLRDASQQLLGTVKVKSEGGSARIEIANHQAGTERAVIRLLPSGDVEIQPLPGGKLVVSAPLHAEQVFYQPSGAAGNPVGPKRWLP